jgi:hypothetical protein
VLSPENKPLHRVVIRIQNTSALLPDGRAPLAGLS